jgi:hypothetical protein
MWFAFNIMVICGSREIELDTKNASCKLNLVPNYIFLLEHTWIGIVVPIPIKSTKEYETKNNERA